MLSIPKHLKYSLFLLLYFKITSKQVASIPESRIEIVKKRQSLKINKVEHLTRLYRVSFYT